jgi:hypothetical protein
MKLRLSPSLALFVLTGALLPAGAARAADGPAYHLSLSDPSHPGYQLPYDVDTGALRKLSDSPDAGEPPYSIPDSNVPAAQRLFDVFAWQSFLALNWPATSDGAPDPTKTIADATAPRVWESYVDVALVYKENGAAPDPWQKASLQSESGHTFWMEGMGIGRPPEDPALGSIRTPVLDESLQAFTGPLIDQSGKWVRYEAAMNDVEFDYVVENKLYNLEGQEAYTSRHAIAFPVGDQEEHRRGAMEIKMSWKELNPARDDPARFFVRQAKVVHLDGSVSTGTFGLVGMHVAVRAKSSPTWIWATFEQVDNTAVNDLDHDSQGRPLRPNFYNPDNPSKPVNVLAPKNAAPVNRYNPATGKDDGPAAYTSWDESQTTDPTQATMVTPIPKATEALNQEVQTQLAQLGSVFRYYELIGTQWPAQPSFPGFSNGVGTQADGRLLPSSPESILFKVPGKIVPLFLVNTTMETFFQNGNQPAGPVADDYRLPPGLLADPSTIFATESCAGCHFSAGACIGFKHDPSGRLVLNPVTSPDGKTTVYYRVPIFGQNADRGATGDADYSWLFQLRSQSAPVQYDPSKDTLLTQAVIAAVQKICPAQ